MNISIEQQAIAVELAARGKLDFVDRLGTRMAPETQAQYRRRAEELFAAAKTLYGMRDKEAANKAALGKGAA